MKMTDDYTKEKLLVENTRAPLAKRTVEWGLPKVPSEWLDEQGHMKQKIKDAYNEAIEECFKKLLERIRSND